MCDTPPVSWNQLPCCPEPFTHPNDSHDFVPSVREPRSYSRERSVHAIKKRSPGVKKWQNQSCIYPFVHVEPLYEEFHIFLSEIPFRVIHDCRGNHTGSDLHTKCLDFTSLSSFESVIPVVDRNTKTIYANRFCAECNAIQDSHAFPHEFVCRNALLGNWELLSLERTQENEMVLIRSGLCVYFLKGSETNSLDIVAGNRCSSAKYTDCSHSEDALVVENWYKYNSLSKQYFQDGYHCALCGNQSDSFSGIGQSVIRSVQTSCSYGCALDVVMSFSFFVLMSLDKALIPVSDDRIMEPRDLKCGNQSNDIYDIFMVGMILKFRLIFNYYTIIDLCWGEHVCVIQFRPCCQV